jgi:autotransporter translocation and assembly factor TamB
VGDAALDGLGARDLAVESATASYDATVPPDAPLRSTARVEGRAVTVDALGQRLEGLAGTVSMAERTLGLDVTLTRRENQRGKISGTMLIASDGRSLDVSALILDAPGSSWRLATAGRAPTVSWSPESIRLDPMVFEHVDHADQQLSLSGTWRTDGTGLLRATASHVFLDTLTPVQPPRYGGIIDGEASLGGTLERPSITARFTVSDGRVRELSYEKFTARVDYAGEALAVDARLDQAPGVWLTVSGRAPLSLFDGTRTEQPIDLAVASSPIALGLIEGVTDVVRDVTGSMRLDFRVIGTSQDPHFAGRVDIDNAAFRVNSSGSRYRNGRAALRLGSERVAVEAFHLEDSRGRALELAGSLGTHELTLGDLEIDATAKGFEVLRNEFGTIEIDAGLRLRGMAESPRVEGSLAIASGELKIDEILDRTLFRPYATEAAVLPEVDAIAALNPWDRLGLNIELRIPGTLRMTGDEVQVASGTPLGLGSFNLRAIGDLYLYKDPGDVMYVTGSLDSVSGTYAFQGRRFDIDPTSSINFQGDLNPAPYVTVERLISGVLTRVTILGSLREPELQLTSTPPLEPSDVLSLIVFGTSTNQLSGLQQEQLAIRAGALAAGFLATPLVDALERSLGLDILEIEAPADARSGPRVTIGDELAPGLVARFSRQFGFEEYDEATIEYYLSRILRIRATFSDAGTLNARAPFRRTERAGIDLILFFSF